MKGKLAMTQNTNSIDFGIFKEYIKKQKEFSKNVGIAVSFVTGNEVLFEEGIGYRDLSDKLPFTPETIFPLGSHTKSFTATAIALLIDEGKFGWDEPIRNYIPKFQLKDPFVTEKCTIRDVLSHTTGFPHHQFMYMNSDWKYNQIFDRLQYLDLAFDFRTIHKYSNLNYMIATGIIEEITGRTYFSFLNEKFLKPLGMTRTNFSTQESFKSDNYSLGYRKTEEDFEKETYPDIKYFAGGAGSINSCLKDMSKWIQFHINKGKVKNKQLITEKTLENLYVMQRLDRNPFSTIIPDKNYVQNYGYALGWWSINYRGMEMRQHIGTGQGIIFNGGFMPGNNLGYVLFSNTSGSDIPFYLNFDFVDQVLGLEQVYWGEKIREFEEKQTKVVEEQKRNFKDPQKRNTSPSHSIENFVGIYHHPGYGNLEFNIENNKLQCKYGEDSNIELNHYHYNTYTINIKTLGGFGTTKFVSFRDNFEGEISHLECNAEPLLEPAIFKKIIKQ